MTADVICLSRAMGAGGDQIGRAVAQELGLRYVDDDVIRRAAENAGLPAGVVADAERRKGRL